MHVKKVRMLAAAGAILVFGATLCPPAAQAYWDRYHRWHRDRGGITLGFDLGPTFYSYLDPYYYAPPPPAYYYPDDGYYYDPPPVYYAPTPSYYYGGPEFSVRARIK